MHDCCSFYTIQLTPQLKAKEGGVGWTSGTCAHRFMLQACTQGPK